MARKNPNKNPNTESNNSIQTNNPNGINWSALGNQPGEVNWDTLSGPIEKEAIEVRNQALGEMAIRAVNNYRDARKKAAYIGSYYEMVDKRVKKDETGLLQKGVVYTMLKEKYGNALDRQGRYKEKLESLPGTTSHPEWISGDIMVDIANRIPKIKGQTGKEYVEYITKIRDQIPPRRKNEDIEAYKQRILEVFNTGDLQFIAANALMDSQSEIDQQIKERLERIKEFKEKLEELEKNPSSGIGTDRRLYFKDVLKRLKEELLDVVAEAEEQKKALMADIANRIPKIKGQTGKEYVEYITKIRDQIPPRRKNEDIEAYKQRILEVFNTGDLQFIAANALMDSQSEIDQQIKERLERIKGLEKKLGQTSGMAQEKQNKLRGKLKQAKLDLYKMAVSAEEEDIEARKCKSNTGKETPASEEQGYKVRKKPILRGMARPIFDKARKHDPDERRRKPNTGEETPASEERRYKVRRRSIFHKIASPVLKLFDSKDERRGSRRRNSRRNKLREKAKKEGMATISDLIPKMEWQTKDDYKEFIARIYSEHPKLTSDTSDEYKRDINNADFYASVACALIDSQSSNGHTDGVGEEMRAKFEQIDATLNGGFSSDGVTKLDARIKEARIKALKDIVEKEIKASPNH